MGQHVNFDGKKNQFSSITTEQTSEKWVPETEKLFSKTYH